MKYRVVFEEIIKYAIDVEAENEEDAMMMADEIVFKDAESREQHEIDNDSNGYVEEIQGDDNV